MDVSYSVFNCISRYFKIVILSSSVLRSEIFHPLLVVRIIFSKATWQNASRTLTKPLIFSIFKFFLYLFFWLHSTRCGILVRLTRIEPVPSAVKARSPKHWTAREFPNHLFLIQYFHIWDYFP